MATSPALVLSQNGRTATTGQNSLSQLQNDLIARASQNDYDAALRLGMGFTSGHFGLKVNYDEARKYLRIAALGVKEAGKNSQHWKIGCVAKAYAIQHKTSLTDAFVKEVFDGRAPSKGIVDNSASNYGTDSSFKYIPAMFLRALNAYEVHIKRKESSPEFTQEEIEEDIRFTVKELKICVENSFMPALALMGILECEGVIDGASNIEKGLALLKRAAIEGNDGSAKVYLGEIYASGLYGIDRNLKEAKRWYTSAMEQNIPEGSAGIRLVERLKKANCVLL